MDTLDKIAENSAAQVPGVERFCNVWRAVINKNCLLLINLLLLSIVLAAPVNVVKSFSNICGRLDVKLQKGSLQAYVSNMIVWLQLKIPYLSGMVLHYGTCQSLLPFLLWFPIDRIED